MFGGVPLAPCASEKMLWGAAAVVGTMGAELPAKEMAALKEKINHRAFTCPDQPTSPASSSIVPARVGRPKHSIELGSCVFHSFTVLVRTLGVAALPQIPVCWWKLSLSAWLRLFCVYPCLWGGCFVGLWHLLGSGAIAIPGRNHFCGREERLGGM